ncbi:thioredoxin-like protein, partial [Cantharellus anzutake]|uniref:thioredoxin-like protein n=1 Tax=Cantharellus anzutake TaxID=1750568 RepID=UPI0019039EA3
PPGAGSHDDDFIPKANQTKDEITSDDEDELFAELERDDYGALREKRLDALKAEIDRAKILRESDHGKLTEITDEKEVVQVSAKEDRCIVHFYHRNFRRCEIMDKHLEVHLSAKHFGTRFIRVFVENVPWLVERLEIKVLPCVICFIRGITKDRLIGFDELGNDDSFTTSVLELRLVQSGTQTFCV